MNARELEGVRVAKARERLESALIALDIDGYRAEIIRQCASDLVAERVREVTLAAIQALQQGGSE